MNNYLTQQLAKAEERRTLDPGAHLGDFVLWNLGSVQPTVQEFQIANSDYGGKCPTPLDGAAFIFETLKEGPYGGLIIRKISGGFSVHEYHKDTDSHTRGARIVWDGQDFITEGTPETEPFMLCQYAKRRLAEQAIEPRLNTSVVRAWLVKEMHSMNRICLRDTGGFWYVSSTHAERLTKLQKLVANIGAQLIIIPQFSTPETKEFLTDQVKFDVWGKINELISESMEWRRFSERDALMRTERLVNMRTELDMWKDILSLQVADMHEALTIVDQRLLQLAA